MNVVIISGSHRKPSQSGRVAQYLRQDFLRLHPQACLSILDLGETPLPLWDEGVWANEPRWKTVWDPIAAKLEAADALIVISPEWSGMAPPGLKNFFLLCSAKLIGHKPALLVAVSSSRGGAFPIAELRSSGYKNSRLCYIPEHIILRDVENLFMEANPVNPDESYLRNRISYALNLLAAYGDALKVIRASNLVDHKTYPNGMS